MSGIGITQAVLVSQPRYDDSQMTGRLALFDEDTGAPYPFEGEDWHTVSDSELQNGWMTYKARGGRSSPPQYRKRPNGMVELRGLIVPGTTGLVFNLPEGYRHDRELDMHWPIATAAGFASFAVSSSGNVIAVTTAGTDWHSLAPIMFSIK